jgi:DNA-directed RNA polymerase specialized sigma24 family protein
VGRAGKEQGSPGPALEELLRIYRPPILAFLRASCRARKYRTGESYHEDLCQEFCANLLCNPLLQRADPSRGSRFRSYLTSALTNFVNNDLRAVMALKRGGELTEAADMAVDSLVSSGLSPEEAFEGEWVATVLEEAARRTCGDHILLNDLRPYLLGPREAGAWEAIAKAHGMKPATVRVSMSRLKSKFRAQLMDVVRETVGDVQDFEEELAFLLGK